MPSQSKIIRLISELTRMTAKDEIEWETKDIPGDLTAGTNDVYPLYFQAQYKSQRIGLAQRRYQAYDGDRDLFYWTEEVVLMFLDWRGKPIWEERSPSAALFNLFETIRAKVANVDGIINELLGEDNESL